MLTRAQTKKLEAKDICTCSTSQNVSPTINANDKKEITDIVNCFFKALRVGLEKESSTNKVALSFLQESIEAGKKSNKLGLKPECFTGLL